MPDAFELAEAHARARALERLRDACPAARTIGTVVNTLVGNGLVILGLWLLGGVIATSGALAYGELGAAMPSAGAEYVYLHDLFPTFQEVAGLQPHDEEDSASILEQMLGRDTPLGRESVYGAFASQIFPSPMRFVRTRTHKLVYNRVEIGELYDLESDPGERVNLIGQAAYTGIRADLHARLLAWMEARARERFDEFTDAVPCVIRVSAYDNQQDRIDLFTRHGFRPVRHKLEIYGLCRQCQEAGVELPDDGLTCPIEIV